MKIDIINNALPPRQDAIGQYTAKVASALTQLGHDIRILAEEGHSFDPIHGVEIVSAFRTNPPQGTRSLTEIIGKRKPDWVILQYNPFSYGNRGFNPYLPGVMVQAKRETPGLRIAVMVHEPFVPWHVNLPFFVMSLWQRPQMRQLGAAADVIFLSIESWFKELEKWFPRKPLYHVPVPSLIDQVEITREAARERLGIAQDVPVLGVFGTAHISRLMPTIQATLDRVLAVRDDVKLVYVGPDKATFEPLFGSVGIYTEGFVDDAEVSRRFAAMDISLSTFIDGVSSRRSSLMTSLQHGIAAVGTTGKNTDNIFLQNAGDGPLLLPADDVSGFAEATLRLVQDSDQRERVARHGHELYRNNFDMAHISHQMNEILKKHR